LLRAKDVTLRAKIADSTHLEIVELQGIFDPGILEGIH
jgi:hypothetical protein